MNLREPIPEAYSANFNTAIASKSYPSRRANMLLKDINRDDYYRKSATISDIEMYIERVKDTIRTDSIKYSNGSVGSLKNFDGIDILGNLIESNGNSVNLNYYGSLHNDLHAVICYIHDPDKSRMVSYYESWYLCALLVNLYIVKSNPCKCINKNSSFAKI